jgi:hypothetical protein
VAEPRAYDSKGRFRGKLRTIWPFRPGPVGPAYSGRYAPTRFDIRQERPICIDRSVDRACAPTSTSSCRRICRPCASTWRPRQPQTGESQKTNGPEYLRARDIARLTGVHLRTARRWIANKIIVSGKLGGARLVAKGQLERLKYGRSCSVAASMRVLGLL